MSISCRISEMVQYRCKLLLITSDIWSRNVAYALSIGTGVNVLEWVPNDHYALCFKMRVFQSWVYLHSNFRGGLRKRHVFWNGVRNGPSRSSKVVDFDTNRKPVCGFLLVITWFYNLGSILPCFRDIAGFWISATPPLLHLKFRGVSLEFGLGCRYVVAPMSKDPKLIIRVITFELTQHILDTTTSRTDGRLTMTIPR